MKVNKRGVIVLIILSLCLIFSLIYYRNIVKIIKVIILSFILAYILFPMRDYIRRKAKINKKAASLLVVIVIFFAVVVGIINLIPKLFDEAANMGNVVEQITKYAEELYLKLKLSGIPIFDDIYNSLVEKGNSLFVQLSDKALEIVIKYSNELLSYAVIPIIIYYFLSDGEKLYNRVFLIIPAEKRIFVKKIISNIDRVLSRYIAGQFYLCIIISLFSFLIYFIFKVKFIIGLSILNGVFNIIPYFGPILGGVPAIAVAFMDSTSKGIYVALSLILLQQIEGNILSPAITGKSIDMHPFAIIVLLLVGENIGGFLGMIMIIPIAVTIKVIYNDINYYLF